LNGCSFILIDYPYLILDNLSFDYGLSIKVPPSNYSAESWCELTLPEQIKLIDSFYPDVAEEAKKVLNCFDDRKIIIVDHDERNRTVNYVDRRLDSRSSS